MAVMDRSSTVRFAHAARRLGAAARAAGLTVPAFRSPPRRPGAPRTIRRLPGGPVVAVALRDRVFAEVLADMVEGIVIANRLEGPAAGRIRRTLLDAVVSPGVSAVGVAAHWRASPGPGGGMADAGGLNPPVPSGA